MAIPSDQEMRRFEDEATHEEFCRLMHAVVGGPSDLSPGARRQLGILLWHQRIKRETRERKIAETAAFAADASAAFVQAAGGNIKQAAE